MTDIKAHITGTIWKIKVEAGATVEEGDVLVIIESMKMEMPIEADDPGTVKEVRAKEGQPVNEGDVLLVIDD
jgi:acetyl-CoA carboxylase biotin carboxyl carrier protein